MVLWKKNVPAAILLALLTLLLYGDALSGWWRWDDPDHLVHAIDYSPSAYFFVPEVWQRISPANFTPLLTFSYDIDQWLFGMQPLGFYVHHLLALIAAVVMTFLLLTLWLPRTWAFAGSVLFLCGVPVLTVAEQLMTRHYIEGLVFACAGLYLFVLAGRSRRPTYAWIGGGCYLLAMLAKEIYVPLLLMLPLINERSGERQNKNVVPYMLAAAIYVLWRLYMLDAPVSGYSSWDTFSFQSAMSQFANAPFLLLGGGWMGIVAALSLCLIIVSALSVCPKRILLFAVAFVLLLAPLVPLTYWPRITEPNRFLLMVWWGGNVATVSSAAVLWQYRKWRIPLIIIAVMIAGTLLTHWKVQRELMFSEIAEREASGRFIWEGDKTGIFFMSPLMSASYWYFDRLAGLRTRMLRTEPPLLVVDEMQLTGMNGEDRSVWRYDHSCRCIMDVTVIIPDHLHAWRSKLSEKTLHVEGYSSANAFSWEFGPYSDGYYSVIGKVIGKVALPARGRFQTSVQPGVMVLRYDSPEGWVTYSEPFRLSANGVEWMTERKADH